MGVFVKIDPGKRRQLGGFFAKVENNVYTLIVPCRSTRGGSIL